MKGSNSEANLLRRNTTPTIETLSPCNRTYNYLKRSAE
jgi:hypothetical protein